MFTDEYREVLKKSIADTIDMSEKLSALPGNISFGWHYVIDNKMFIIEWKMKQIPETKTEITEILPETEDK